MSTLKTNNIQHVDRSDPSIIINTDGSVNIAGTMTYEDVTNVDAVGIITGRSNIDAQKQVHVGTGVSVKAGGLNVTAGITTVQALQATTGTFSGDVDIASSLVHTGDTDTKISFATNTIKFDTDTSERARVTSTGELVMGTTSSNGARVVIQQNSSDTNPLDQATSADSSGVRIQNYSFGVGRYSALSLEACNSTSVQSASIIAQSVSSGTSPDIIIAQRTSTSANTERLRITSDGQLIHKVSKSSGYIAEFHQDNSGNSAQILIDSPTDNNIRPTSIDLAQAGTVKWSLGQAYASSSSQAFHIATSSLSANDTNAKLTITTAGLVGIGTAVPDQTLEVFKASGTNLVKVTSQANSTVGLEIEKTGATTQSWRIVDGQTANGKLEFYDVTDSATRMTIDGSGRIGINNSTPSESLHVSGNIINSESVGGTGDKGIMLGSGHRLGLDQTGTRSWTFKPTNGQLQLNSGDGAGSFRLARVAFGGDSADANCLDDYEEGDFTPQMHDGNGSNTVLSIISGRCFYIKIGTLCYVSASVTLTDTGKTGTLTMTHLPFSSPNIPQLAVGNWWMDRGSPANGDIVGGTIYKTPNTAAIVFVNPTNGDSSSSSATEADSRYWQFNQWTNGRPVYLNFTYRTQ